MTTINALLAATSAAYTQVRNTLKEAREAAASDTFAGFTPEQGRALRVFKSLAIGREPSPPVTIGPKTYRLFDVVIDSNKLERIDEEYPSAFVVLGAWLPNGLQYGQTMTVVVDPPEPGDVSVRERTVISGTPVYPIHPRLLDFMPDDVEYNADGTEKSRKRPTQLKQVHKYLGWADKRWT